ncbi:MAG: BrnT family toxin [Planctomycetes bacterium]|nr:BrnT family toxin [Planctomycetota bacterium]
MEFNFDWDPKKAILNRRKHRVSFEQAVAVFRDPRAISLYDEGHSEPEDRWITLGLSGVGAVLVVCHTFKQIDPTTVQIRIISSRKATRREIKQYWEPTRK